MTSVSLKKNTAIELVSYKLRNIRKEIEKILPRWNETSAQNFLNNAQIGKYSEAENDAIDLKQLLLEEKKLKNLMENFKEN